MEINKALPVDRLSYDAAFAELEQVVAALERNTLALEESLALYERGQALAKRCTQLLEEAELRVRVLSGDTLPEEEA
ncbi:MAG TPA: exodeoxyribonuclease VII small subunit [Anaerolineaceae bacterium]